MQSVGGGFANRKRKEKSPNALASTFVRHCCERPLHRQYILLIKHVHVPLIDTAMKRTNGKATTVNIFYRPYSRGEHFPKRHFQP